MKNYKFNATKLIAKTFEERGVMFRVCNTGRNEELLTEFPVDNGPRVTLKYISCDNDNDVAVRIFGLFTNIAREKSDRVMKACNYLNRKMRFVKFYVDSDRDVNIEYDFLVHAGNDCVGEMAFEIFIRVMNILDTEYEVFAKALYTDEDFIDDEEDASEFVGKHLHRLREMLESHLRKHNGTEDTPADEGTDAMDEESDFESLDDINEQLHRMQEEIKNEIDSLLKEHEDEQDYEENYGPYGPLEEEPLPWIERMKRMLEARPREYKDEQDNTEETDGEIDESGADDDFAAFLSSHSDESSEDGM